MNWPANTIIINTWNSICNGCGRNAFPGERKHDTVGSWGGTAPGCGIEWKYSASEYRGLRESVESRWPEYEWIGWSE